MSATPTMLRLPAAATAGFGALLAWEWRQLARRPLLWLVLMLLALAAIGGARSGATLHHAQQAAQQRENAALAAWTAQLHADAQRYASTPGEPLPYWQDPTDVAGFSRYFLRAHAHKPRLALSPLAVGVSDLLPPRLPVALETPFGIAPTYDFEHPRGLALGRFDLGFVLAWLLPVAVVVLFALLGTFERDHGMLRLIAAQGARPRTWLAARVLALLAWLLPGVLLATLLALAVAGVPLTAAGPELPMALMLIAAYTLLWSALAWCVLAAWPGAAGAISVLTATWLLLALGVPTLAQLAWPVDAGAAAQRVDTQRRIGDAVDGARDELLAAALRNRPGFERLGEPLVKMDYATRLTFLTPHMEQRLASLHAQRAEQARTDRARSRAVAWLSPPLLMQETLATLAGTDAARHQAFESQVRAYQLRLRGFFYPRVQAQLRTPTPRPPGQARMNFNDYDAIPRYVHTEAAPTARIDATVPALAWWLLLAAVLAAWGAHRLRHWPREL